MCEDGSEAYKSNEWRDLKRIHSNEMVQLNSVSEITVPQTLS